jgi:hypothetical protein
MKLISRLSLSHLALTCAAFTAMPASADFLMIDDFTTPIAHQTLTGANADDPWDENGQAGVQFPVSGPGILGGERDSQFWVGFGPEEEEWSFGVDPARGLYWESDPNIHVNMNLEWDGSGDGTTFGGAPLAPNPLRADLTGYTGFRLEFAYSTQPLFVRWILANKDLEDPMNTTPQGGSRWQATIPGDQLQPFTVDMPFSEFTDPFVDFGIPALDFTDANTLVLSILSAEGVTGNSFELRSIALVPEPASLGLLACAGVFALRRRRN